ncbi:hypothetical protein LQW54_006427 [Pestalotiopsis sp. IQ-011]
MCGRYALALRPAQIRQMLQDQNMPVDEVPEDEGDGAPRQSYNFAPGYHGVVYRADVPHYGAGPRQHQGRSSSQSHASSATNDNSSGDADNVKSVSDEQGDDGAAKETHYKLQSMKWGLIPFWTKRNPDYGSMMKTINCRDDSLAQGGGMWSTMKARKRCIVVAQGFYEWLKREGSRDKIPHFVKRRDGHLMCFAGLWDCVQYDDDDDDGGGDDDNGAQKRSRQKQMHYTYTIITTDSNAQLRFLHDRMPVILDNGSEALRTWLDPGRHEWTKELQGLLKPFQGELEVYPVSKEVGKVGNNSPTFVVPIDSKENKSNIANFFAKGGAKKSSPSKKEEEDLATEQPEIEVKKDTGFVEEKTAPEEDSKDKIARDVGESLAKLSSGVKRVADDDIKNGDENGPPKKALRSTGPVQSPSPLKKQGWPKISATSNGTKSPQKSKQGGTQKITKFFGNSS